MPVLSAEQRIERIRAKHNGGKPGAGAGAGAGTDTGAGTPFDALTAAGAILQAGEGQSTATAETDRADSSIDRADTSSKPGNARNRETNGRDSRELYRELGRTDTEVNQGNGSPDTTPSAASTAARSATSEEPHQDLGEPLLILESPATEAKKRGRKPGFSPAKKTKEEAKKEEKGLDGWELFTDQEVTEVRSGLKKTVKDYMGYLDEGISYSNIKKVRVVIWGNMDDEELEVIVTVWLKNAKRNKIVAKAVRIAVDTHDYVALLMILSPRFYKTLIFYKENGIGL